MVTKRNSTGEDKPIGGGFFDSNLSEQIKASAQQIWLAGMGAFARAQEEGGKVFETLAKEGLNLQQKMKATGGAAADKAADATGRAGEWQARAEQGWSQFESLIEDRTARALKRLGVPTARELEALTAKVDELTAEVARLSRSAHAKRPANAKASAGSIGKKAAVKRAAARKAAPKTD